MLPSGDPGQRLCCSVLAAGASREDSGSESDPCRHQPPFERGPPGTSRKKSAAFPTEVIPTKPQLGAQLAEISIHHKLRPHSPSPDATGAIRCHIDHSMSPSSPCSPAAPRLPGQEGKMRFGARSLPRGLALLLTPLPHRAQLPALWAGVLWGCWRQDPPPKHVSETG